jgi:hypothetical protein
MKKLKFYLLIPCVFAVCIATYAQEKSYPIGNSTRVLSNFRRQLAGNGAENANKLMAWLYKNTRVLYDAGFICKLVCI